MFRAPAFTGVTKFVTIKPLKLRRFTANISAHGAGGRVFSESLFPRQSYTNVRSKKQEFPEAPVERRGRPEPFRQEPFKQAGQ